MATINHAELYKTQISLTEWFERMGHDKTEELRIEDNVKRDRLAVISDITGLPFDRPTSFHASDLAHSTDVWMSYLEAHGDDLCALRLIPQEAGMPKLRMRGDTVRRVFEGWFQEQDIDHAKYQADVVPHTEHHLYSTIFVVNEHGIFGEVVFGTHAQLTQGFHESLEPMTFSYDFEKITVTPHDPVAEDYLYELVEYLHVDDQEKRSQLTQRLNARFANDFLMGYFESVSSIKYGTWFIDYNRILGEVYADFKVETASVDASVKGQVGSRGIARGRVRVVPTDELDCEFAKGDILVCSMTTPAYMPIMMKAGAVVTDMGGILTHSAITCREMDKPCIIGTKNATEVLTEGMMVEVDANAGVVHIL